MNGEAGLRPLWGTLLLRFLPAAMGLWVGMVPAQSLTVTPLRVDVTTAEPVGVLTLRNDDPKYPTLIQVRPNGWTVVDGADRYDPTRELVVSPTVFRLGPGQAQTVRMSIRGRPDARVERLYRVFLQQVPDEAEQSRRTGNVRFLFTVGIPVVVAPSDNPEPAARIVWRVEVGATNGGYRLKAVNDGTAHQKISAVTLVTREGEVRIADGAIYLLPGTERVWDFKPAAKLPSGPVDLKVVADDGTSKIIQAVAAD